MPRNNATVGMNGSFASNFNEEARRNFEDLSNFNDDENEDDPGEDALLNN